MSRASCTAVRRALLKLSTFFNACLLVALLFLQFLQFLQLTAVPGTDDDVMMMFIDVYPGEELYRRRTLKSTLHSTIFWEMVKFVDLGVLYVSLVLPRQSRWTAGGPEWTLRALGGKHLQA